MTFHRPADLPTSPGSATSSEPSSTSLDADAAPINGEPLPSARVPLSRDRILSGAIALIDEHGVGQLTMRRLGASLGVEAMSLYRYIPSREQLLDGVVHSLVEGLDHDPEVVREPTHGWQDFLQRLAHGIRRVALAHPRCFSLVASRAPQAPWLRPPLCSVDWVELFLNGLLAEGFDDERAVAAYRAFSSFLLGHLLLETSQLGADTGPLGVVEDTGATAGEGDVAAHATVARLQDVLSADHAAAEFDASLEGLLDRLQGHARAARAVIAAGSVIANGTQGEPAHRS